MADSAAAAITATLPLIEILKVGGIGGVVAALANQVLGWLRDFLKERAEHRRKATYTALRLAIVLERYAIACADTIGDNDLHKQSGGTAGVYHRNMPALEPYPGDVDWRSLEPPLAALCLAIPLDLEMASGILKFHWELDADHDSARDDCDAQCGLCGLQAWETASRLRSRYRLPAFSLPHRWDFEKVLREQVAQGKG